MCELFGYSGNGGQISQVMVKEFFSHAKNNPDGWGLAAYDENICLYGKSPEPGNTIRARRLQNKFIRDISINSPVTIGHIRKATSEVNYKNTHPFVRIHEDQYWSFAHNGILYDLENLYLDKFFPEGTTDSEHAFCYFLERISFQENATTNAEIERMLWHINSFGIFNVLMSQVQYLYAYRTVKRSKYYNPSLYYLDNDGNIYVSTKPLGIYPEKWIEIPEGKLVVFDNGKKIY